MQQWVVGGDGFKCTKFSVPAVRATSFNDLDIFLVLG